MTIKLPFKAKVRCYVFHNSQELIVYFDIPFAAFSLLYPKTIWPFLFLSFCYDDIHIFGGEILAC